MSARRIEQVVATLVLSLGAFTVWVTSGGAAALGVRRGVGILLTVVALLVLAVAVAITWRQITGILGKLQAQPAEPLRQPSTAPAHTAGVQYRQGDVFIERIEHLPPGLTQVPRDRGRLVLAYGEKTGHAHVVKGRAELLSRHIDDPEEDRFLHVEGEATLVHEEHGPIPLPPGDYRVTLQREYTPPPL